MITAQARRGKGIDDVIGGMAPTMPEQEIKQKVVGTTNVERVIEEYKRLLDMNLGWQYGRLVQLPRFKEVIQQFPVLTPAEISGLVYKLLEVDTDNYNRWEVENVQAGVLNHSIQQSYNVGHNNFHLDLLDFTQPISYLVSSCKGQRRRPLEVSVEGNVRNSFASRSRYVRARIDGIVGNRCGGHAVHCDITLQKAYYSCGKKSLFSTFHIIEAGDTLGEKALFSTFYVGTKLGFSLEDRHPFMCSYVTENREVFEKIKEHIGNPNKIVLIQPNGEREISWYRR